MGLRVCFLALEYFGWGRYGGIGKATRGLAEGLVERGVEVSAVVPLGKNQRSYEEVNGVRIFGYPLWRMSARRRVLKKINADVYHSQDPNISTVSALRTLPERVQIVTFQNPKSTGDWSKVNMYYRPRRLWYNRLIEPIIRREIKKCDRFFCQAKYTLSKAKEIYNLETEPVFMPNPIKVPAQEPYKFERPLIMFLGRLDGEKNPERFIELATSFPGFEFVLAGLAHSEKRRIYLDKLLKPGNLRLAGFVDGPVKAKLLEKTWILVNTSVSECLPVSFLEALSYGCSLLSNHDPDGLTSSFGFYTPIGDFERGLEYLLEDDNWRGLGSKGRRYVKENHEMEKVIDLHLEHYMELSDL